MALQGVKYIRISAVVPAVLLISSFILTVSSQISAEETKSSLTLLDKYITQALEGNSDLKAAEENWKAAVSRAMAAGAPPDPRFTYGLYIQPVETRTGPQRQRFGISQTFPWFGKLSLKEKQAVLEAEAMGAKADLLRVGIIQQVKQAYYEYSFAVQAINTAKKNLDLLAYLEKVADSRYAAGLSNYALTVRLRIETSRMEDRLRSLIDLRVPLTAKLNAAMGLPTDTPIPEPAEVPVMQSEMTDEEILKTLDEYNPEIRGLLIQARAAGEGVRLAEKGFYPDFTLGLEMIQQDRARSGDPLHNGDDPLVATFSINLPIWFDARRAAVSEASLKEKSLQRQASGARDRIRASMQLALFKYRDAGRRLQLLDTALIPKAEQALEATLDAFQTGTQSVLELIDAEKTMLEFQLAHQRALADQAIYMAEMESLMGKEIPCRFHSMPPRRPFLNNK